MTSQHKGVVFGKIIHNTSGTKDRDLGAISGFGTYETRFDPAAAAAAAPTLWIVLTHTDIPSESILRQMAALPNYSHLWNLLNEEDDPQWNVTPQQCATAVTANMDRIKYGIGLVNGPVDPAAQFIVSIGSQIHAWGQGVTPWFPQVWALLDNAHRNLINYFGCHYYPEADPQVGADIYNTWFPANFIAVQRVGLAGMSPAPAHTHILLTEIGFDMNGAHRNVITEAAYPAALELALGSNVSGWYWFASEYYTIDQYGARHEYSPLIEPVGDSNVMTALGNGFKNA